MPGRRPVGTARAVPDIQTYNKIISRFYTINKKNTVCHNGDPRGPRYNKRYSFLLIKKIPIITKKKFTMFVTKKHNAIFYKMRVVAHYTINFATITFIITTKIFILHKNTSKLLRGRSEQLQI